MKLHRYNVLPAIVVFIVVLLILVLLSIASYDNWAPLP
jgi:hypothetical protein